VNGVPTVARWVLDTWAAVWGPAAHIVGIVVGALVVRVVLHRVITRLARRSAERVVPTKVFGSERAAQVLAESAALSRARQSVALSSVRRRQRVGTVAAIGRSTVSILVFFVAVLMILAELGLNIAPMLASAGVLGVALGFGAQNLVKDFLSGTALILEDQFGVGDVVDLGPVVGVVEDVGLRCTQVRDVTGALWFVRNGEILRVANKSQDWARVVLDVDVAPDADLDHARQVLVDTAVAMAAEPEWAESVLEVPTSWGVESISGDRAVLRLVVLTSPEKKDDAARELRRRVVPAMHAAGVPVPEPAASALARLVGRP